MREPAYRRCRFAVCVCVVYSASESVCVCNVEKSSRKNRRLRARVSEKKARGTVSMDILIGARRGLLFLISVVEKLVI